MNSLTDANREDSDQPAICSGRSEPSLFAISITVAQQIVPADSKDSEQAEQVEGWAKSPLFTNAT